MRQTILRLVCDDCGRIAQFEITNSNPLTANTNIAEDVRKRGWNARLKEHGSQFDTYDQCPTCNKREEPTP